MMMMMTEGREGVDSGVCFSFWFSFFLSAWTSGLLFLITLWYTQYRGTYGGGSGVHLADQVGYLRYGWTSGYITPYDIVLFVVGWEGFGVWFGMVWDGME
jgi:hypothetical protein